jgi:hypothetical protein
MTIAKADILVANPDQNVNDGFSQTNKLESIITNKAQKRIESMTVAELSALVKNSESKQAPKDRSYCEPAQDATVDLQELLIRLRQSALPLVRKQLYKELAKQTSHNIKQNSCSYIINLILFLLFVVGTIVGLLYGTGVLQPALSGIVNIAVQVFDYIKINGIYFLPLILIFFFFMIFSYIVHRPII